MNCEYFGDKIYLFRLFELMDNCTIVPVNETDIVESIPITGFNPTADSCFLDFKCYYSEDVKNRQSNTKFWFDLSNSAVLFYLSSNPQSSDVYFTSRDGGYDSVFTPDIAVSDASIVEVTIEPDSNTGGIPSRVVLDLNYYQKDIRTKILISAKVTLKDYSLDVLNSDFPAYTLEINYFALGWFELFNSFRLGLTVFTFVFIIIGFFMLFIIFLIYWIHLTLFKYKDYPKLHFKMYLPVITIPPTLGTLYGNVPLVIVIYVLKFVYDEDIFRNVTAD